MPPETLAIKLRQARGAMSLAEAAQLSEIPEERIRMYEEGLRRPYGKTLRRLADVYGVRVAELVGPGQVMRPRGRAPDVRRRRRIVASREEGLPIAVPVEVSEGETVRVVIELVVRRRESQTPVEDTPVGREDEPRPDRLLAPGPQPMPPDEEDEGGAAVGEREETPGVRRLRLADDVGRQPRDPILELKRAYSDFRHKKK